MALIGWLSALTFVFGLCFMSVYLIKSEFLLFKYILLWDKINFEFKESSMYFFLYFLEIALLELYPKFIVFGICEEIEKKLSECLQFTRKHG